MANPFFIRFLTMIIGFLVECVEVMREAHQGQRRKSGDPYEKHPLAVAAMYPRFVPMILFARVLSSS